MTEAEREEIWAERWRVFDTVCLFVIIPVLGACLLALWVVGLMQS